VVAREDIAVGTRLAPRMLAVRRVPARYAPHGAAADPATLGGLQLAVAVPAGQEITSALVGDPASDAPGPAIRAGERVAEVVASASVDQVQPGGRVDVLVTTDDRPGSAGRTVLALEDVEVLAVAPSSGGEDAAAGTPAVAASLRVTLRQAVYLAAAGSFAREVRLLPRAPGDRARGRTGLSADASLGAP
jgi:pilus assembly protein CpaB